MPPKKLSKGEETLALQLKAYKIDFVREYQFAPPRKWKADFFILSFKLPARAMIVEVEGGTWGKSRHSTGAGYAKDCEKYNAAAMMGYVVLRYTTDMVLKGEAIEQIKAFINMNKSL